MKFGKEFLFKELVKTFDYTTATQNRNMCTDVSINGRTYTKYGTVQAVTFVGNLYRVSKENSSKRVLMIGMSKQHPCDTKINKQAGYEQAALNTLDNPIVAIEVNKSFNRRRFKNFVENYLSTMKLEFIKTRGEIIASGDDPAKYNR